MKKGLILISVLMLLLMTFGSSAQGTSLDELSTLADYFPEETTVFAVIRTDDAYLNTLDDLLADVNAGLGGLLPPGTSVRGLLDDAVRSIYGRSFESGVRPWLGDSIAVGVTSIEGLTDVDEAADVPFTIAAEVTDAEGAAAFFGELINIEPLQTDTYTLYVDENAEAALLIAEDVLLLGTQVDSIVSQFEATEAALRTSDLFTGTLDLLPNEDYNILLYVDGAALVEQSAALNAQMMDEALSQTDMGAAEGLITTLMQFQADMQGQAAALTGPTAAGFTIIDGRSLVIDIVSQVSDPSVITEAPGYVEQVPVSLDFARYIPGYAQLVIHDNGLGPDFNALFTALDATGPAVQEILTALLQDPQLRSQLQGAEALLDMIDVSVINLGGLVENQITSYFAGFTGLNLQNDVLSWMTGDYANYAALIPVESDLEFSFDLGFVTEATDAEAAANVVAGLTDAAGQYEVANTVEEMGGGTALVYTSVLRGLLQLGGLPQDMLAGTPELDLIVGADDEVFAFAARPGVEFALEPGDDSLLNNPAFQYAAENLFLPEPVTVWYVGTGSFVNAAPALAAALGPTTAQQIAFAASQIESMTITAAVPELGQSIARLTLTLPEVTSGVSANTVVDVAAGNEDFSILVEALNAVPGAVQVLNGPGPFTVFAPTNAAFEAALAELGLTAEELLANEELLNNVLAYHVVPQQLLAEDIVGLDGQTLTTGLTGQELTISIVDGGVVINDSVNVIAADILASNGVIHVIDAVLLPPVED
ncbi:MAG: hypothetical protein OHK0046_16600 [Anaerolineae bacterium]